MSDPALSRLQTLPSWLLGRAASRGHRLVADHLARLDLRLNQHAVLCGIAEHGPLAQAELARAVRIDPKDIVTALNELQARGLLTRERDPRDARKNLIALSTEGRTVLQQAEELGLQANAELTATLSPEERAQLNKLLERLVIDR
ncbi:MarR family winged helix-turn-helix transcriptional regulator [Kitasatospora sp. NPDC059571]|uniref:MarR family winged helix-turn-helix transcriptional regulator n=1 Tax=Kitasatospora sp. NPDC059571 TaxID=3346871 RepID=UPI0036B79F1F